ncbi:MAG: hypothetical protein NTX44_15210 [Ignavibacteriales bacterium]|nr:hypothetical protein [Ignavibacteriales bacterium]
MLRTDKKIHIDWRWVGIGYCFMVVVLLLPGIIFSVVLVYININILNVLINTPTIVRLIATLETIVIAFYIGYRSKGKAIFEPGISALLYYGTMAVSHYSIPKTIGFYYFWAVVVFSYTSMSAWIGKLVQARINRGTVAQIDE